MILPTITITEEEISKERFHSLEDEYEIIYRIAKQKGLPCVGSYFIKPDYNNIHSYCAYRGCHSGTLHISWENNEH